MEKGDKRSKDLQEECIMKCDELDKAQHDIHQMMIDASHRHSEMEDQVDRLGRKESSDEGQYRTEMPLKDARATEEGKTYRERLSCLEEALQKAAEGEQSKSKFDWQSDAEIAAHVNALAHRSSAEKLRSVRDDYEEATRDASAHWSREIAQRDEALLIKDVTLDNERSSFSQQRLDIAKEKSILESEVRHAISLAQEAELKRDLHEISGANNEKALADVRNKKRRTLHGKAMEQRDGGVR